MKNWAIFVNGVFHSRYKRRSDADGNAAFLRQSLPGKLVEVVWDVEQSPALRLAVLVVCSGVWLWCLPALSQSLTVWWLTSDAEHGSYYVPILKVEMGPDKQQEPEQPWWAE